MATTICDTQTRQINGTNQFVRQIQPNTTKFNTLFTEIILTLGARRKCRKNMSERISIESSTKRGNRISFFEHRNKIIGKNQKL